MGAVSLLSLGRGQCWPCVWRTDQEQEVKCTLQVWAQEGGIGGIFFLFTPSPSSWCVEGVRCDRDSYLLCSRDKSDFVFFGFFFTYTEMECGVGEGVKGVLGGNVDPSLTSLAGAASAGSSCHCCFNAYGRKERAVFARHLASASLP